MSNSWRSCNIVVSYNILIVTFIFLIFAHFSQQGVLTSPGGATASCRVFITVASYWFIGSGKDALRGLQSRHLELNWESEGCHPPIHSVTLMTRDPLLAGRMWRNDSSTLSHLWTSQHPSGYFRTGISLGKPRLPGGWDKADIPDIVNENTTRPTPGDHCLPYWAAAYDANRVLLASDCLKIRPTWMWDHKNALGSARVSQLMIPGTHNSGSFYQNEDAISRGDAFSRFTLTQDENVWEQLVWGARYLDLRVGYYRQKGPDRLWINHGPARITELQPILRDIRRFLLLSPGEVVIVDFHRFPVGFSGQSAISRHLRLATMIREELGDFAAKCTSNGSPRLNDMWANKRQLIIAHGERGQVHPPWHADWLCEPLHQAWGNQQTVAGLRAYLEEQMKIHGGKLKLWASMAELTPSLLDSVSRPSRGLRFMADSVNRHITRWFRDAWWRESNIVATDFMLGNKMVDVAIEANLRRRNIRK